MLCLFLNLFYLDPYVIKTIHKYEIQINDLGYKIFLGSILLISST
jgi:hypothetical protein